eukprot:7515149-Pyramimonas_sp.AAC.1
MKLPMVFWLDFNSNTPFTRMLWLAFSPRKSRNQITVAFCLDFSRRRSRNCGRGMGYWPFRLS